MADMHQLENKMRMIKLSGMVETLDMRLSQAQKEGLAFTQFLEMLLEDEVQLTGKSYRALLHPNKDFDKEVVTV